MDRSIKAGIYGFVLVVIVELFLPEVPSYLNFYINFVPSFLVSLLVIYIFRLRDFKDGLVAAFMTYILSYGIVETLGFAALYLEKSSLPSVTVDAGVISLPIVWAGTAVLAGYLGVMIAKTRQQPRRPESEPTIPRELQSV
jgi:hypothetical protein